MSGSVRAKFVCNHVAPYADGSAHIYMNAVYSSASNSENRKFSDATPNGQFQMTIKAGGPADFFKPGIEYYIDISEAVAA